MKITNSQSNVAFKANLSINAEKALKSSGKKVLLISNDEIKQLQNIAKSIGNSKDHIAIEIGSLNKVVDDSQRGYGVDPSFKFSYPMAIATYIKGKLTVKNCGQNTHSDIVISPFRVIKEYLEKLIEN